MAALTGLDKLHRDGFSLLKGKRIGLLCNQASIAIGFEHVLDLLLPLHHSGFLNIGAVFGPEHGLFGHTQDNMIEWEGEPDPRTGLVVHSLYGKHREPTPEMLAGLDLMLVDVPDVGARYYTFIWTMALCMKACEPMGIPVLVLERPNPIGQTQVEGTVMEPDYASFVGLYPLPLRHGLTTAGVAEYLMRRFFPAVGLDTVRMEGVQPGDYFEATGLPWAMPSPNMPTVDTAVVYPGMCLLEATNLSEGRGTTRPFEIFGAPFLDGWKLAESLNALSLPGAVFRPLPFEPTFNKHAQQLCEGCFIHVTDRLAFLPVLTAIALLQQVWRLAPNHAEWKAPPYEYEYEKLPFDILAGNTWLREAITHQVPLDQIRERMDAECRAFGQNWLVT